ncbi:TERB2 protein, partial [Onychorhynchus coronatus]|nr:TERB2 protein [Onychorhynchus coronatus]
RSRRAWFSQSVSPGPRELWVAGGGALTDWLDAEYLFSSDATHPDTRSIHESLRYLEGRATVFHSRYLSACERAGATEKPSVVLGHFVLPPACLQEGQGKKKNPSGFFHQGPSENPTEEPEAVRNGCEEEPEGEALDLDKSSEETDSEAPSPGGFPYRALQEYPINNMVTGYTSARDMKKYEGELHDFIPGMSGYTAYWIQTKISIYCERKTKMKRKL